MKKIVNFEDLLLCRQTKKKLEEMGIAYDKAKLEENPELCREIMQLINYIEE